TPVVVGSFPKSTGKVTKVQNGVVYFDGFQQIVDPAGTAVSPLNSLSGSFTNKAIADSSGKPILVNPAPGQIGSFGLNTLEGPKSVGLDMNMIKRVRITELKEFELRVDAVNVMNHPVFGNPTLNINSLSFGRITSAFGTRRFTFNARLNF